jgi:hypothetical protein
LATQATQVFYLPNIKNGTNWRIARHLSIVICTMCLK